MAAYIILSHVDASASLSSLGVRRDPPLTWPSSRADGIELAEREVSVRSVDVVARQKWGVLTSTIPRTNKITILEVKAVQLVARLFRIHDVLVHHESGAFGIAGYALPYLTALQGLQRHVPV